MNTTDVRPVSVPVKNAPKQVSCSDKIVNGIAYTIVGGIFIGVFVLIVCLLPPVTPAVALLFFIASKDSKKN